MSKTSKTTLGAAIVFHLGILSAACGEPVNTVEYYVQHPHERQKKMLECEKMSLAEMMNQPNCSNASAAIVSAMHAAQRAQNASDRELLNKLRAKQP